MARYVFLMYDSENWHDTVDEQGVADEFALHEEFMAAVTAAGASVVGGQAVHRLRRGVLVEVDTGRGVAAVTSCSNARGPARGRAHTGAGAHG